MTAHLMCKSNTGRQTLLAKAKQLAQKWSTQARKSQLPEKPFAPESWKGADENDVQGFMKVFPCLSWKLESQALHIIAITISQGY